jgi:hypothetical protein
MKKLGLIILLAAFAIFAVVDSIREFRTNDPIHYFSEQPLRLLLVAAIAVTGGMVTFVFLRLSPSWQRGAKLLALGLAGSVLVAFTCDMVYISARLISFAGIANTSFYFILPPLYYGILDAFIWYLFYRVYKKRII